MFIFLFYGIDVFFAQFSDVNLLNGSTLLTALFEGRVDVFVTSAIGLWFVGWLIALVAGKVNSVGKVLPNKTKVI
jgi:hypothetical protein